MGEIIRYTMSAMAGREVPFDIRACLPEDRGRTWEMAREIVFRDGLPNSDLGYPTTIDAGRAPGRLFCCYYGQGPDGATCVQGMYLDV